MMEPQPMKVAIVHDYLTQSGGAERVVEAFHDIWPDAPIFTSVFSANGCPDILFAKASSCWDQPTSQEVFDAVPDGF